jgi:hypothetical protein
MDRPLRFEQHQDTHLSSDAGSFAENTNVGRQMRAGASVVKSKVCGMLTGVRSSVFRVKGLGFRVWGLGCEE